MFSQTSAVAFNFDYVVVVSDIGNYVQFSYRGICQTYSTAKSKINSIGNGIIWFNWGTSTNFPRPITIVEVSIQTLGAIRTTTDCRRERSRCCKLHSRNISKYFQKHIQWPKGIASQLPIPSTSGRPFTSHAGQTTSPRISKKVSKIQQNCVTASSYIFSIQLHFI